MVNEIENSDVGIDDPIAEDQERTEIERQRAISNRQQIRYLKKIAEDHARQEVSQPTGKSKISGQVTNLKQKAKKAKEVKDKVKKTVKRIKLIVKLVETFPVWGSFLLIILVIIVVVTAVIYIATNLCNIPGFSIITSAGSIFSDKAELVDQICSSFGG